MAIASVNPATGERLREFAPLSDREVDERLTWAAAASREWRARPIRERAAVVRRAADILDDEKARFGTLMTLEMGKLFGAAQEEVAKCALACRYYAEHGERLLVPEPVPVEGDR